MKTRILVSVAVLVLLLSGLLPALAQDEVLEAFVNPDLHSSTRICWWIPPGCRRTPPPKACA